MLEESKIKNLLADGELGEASILLVRVTKEIVSPRHNEAIIVSGQVKNIKRIERLGIYKLKTINKESIRLSLSILTILDDISSSFMEHSLQS